MKHHAISDKRVADYFQLEGHVLSTRSADIYRAIDKSKKQSVSVWMLRHPLPTSSEVVDRFFKRMESIYRIEPPVSEMQAYGVDAEGVAFAVFPALDGHSVLEGNIEKAEAERRLTACMRLVGVLHSNGIVCGDICGASFWVDRNGQLQFISVMGSFDTEAAATSLLPPVDTLPYIAPEQRAGGGVEQASDVFSLGVLAYKLLTKHYPFGESSAILTEGFTVDQIIPVSSYVNVPPVWADDVLKNCLHPDPQKRYGSASEVLEAIYKVRERALSEKSVPARVSNASPMQTTISSESSLQASAGPIMSKKERVPKTEKQSSLRLVFISLLLIAMVGIGFAISNNLRTTFEITGGDLNDGFDAHRAVVANTELHGAFEEIGSARTSLVELEASLDKFVASDDPIAHDYLVRSAREARSDEIRTMSEGAIIKRARRLGLMRSAEQVRQWLRTSGARSGGEGYEALLKSLDITLPVEARHVALRRAYIENPDVTLRLAAALSLDSGQLSEYQPVIAQLSADAIGWDSPDKYSTLALILGNWQLATVFGDDVIQRRELIPDGDIIWLLTMLAERNDIYVRSIANLGLERGVLSPLRGVFLEVVRDRGDLSSEVLDSLIRAAAGVLRKEDIAHFGRWQSVITERILLAICADVEDREILREAFDTLAGKSIVVQPAAALIDWVRRAYWENRVDFARVIGVLGSLEYVEESDIRESFQSFDKYVRDARLVSILLDTKHPLVTRVVVQKYASLLNSATLLGLLDNADAEVRIAAIHSLGGLNDVSALRIIIDKYERERDPAVREVYRNTFWVLQNRG